MADLYYTKVAIEGVTVPDLIRATPGSAGYDLTAVVVEVDAYKLITVRTGVRVAIPAETVGVLALRSSMSERYILRNAVGIIDSDYRGEVVAKLLPWPAYENDDHVALLTGLRFAQLIITPLSTGSAYEVGEELPSTARGDGGFGSTGDIIPGVSVTGESITNTLPDGSELLDINLGTSESQ